MDIAFVQPLLDWVAQHPTWAGAIVFLVAFTESLAIVGLFMPGAMLMFGIGALVATGSMELWTTLAWAVAGAIAGDGISFWIGHYYKEELRSVWPFRRYPQLMQRGEAFFEKHGGKSILFGRFVGPVRPIIPAVAGMLGMSPTYFLTINILSAFAWAPAYILPGVAFGASLGLASEVATRLAVLAVLLIAVLWFVQWAVRRIYRFVQPRANDIIERLLAWSESHRVTGRVAASVLNPDYPELRGLLILGTALVLISAGIFAFASLLGGDTIAHINITVFHFFESLRTPLADRLLVAFTQLGNMWINISVFAIVFVWLLWRRYLQAAAHWAGAFGFGLIATWSLKALLRVERPPTAYADIADFAFPSGHTTMSVVLYGFLAVMIACEHQGAMRILPYIAAGSWIATMAVSRLYLGAHWLTDVLGGLLIGIVWVTLLGVAYRRHRPQPLATGQLTSIVAVVLLIGGSWHIAGHHATHMDHYAPLSETRVMELREWWQDGWHTLPVHRIDLRARFEHPLTVQYAGPLGELRKQLERHGWHAPEPLSLVSMLNWLNPNATIRQLPVLPQVHDGWDEELILVRDTGSPQRRIVLRLWPAYVELQTGDNGTQPLWIGNVSYHEIDHRLPFFTIARTGDDFNEPLQRLVADVQGMTTRIVNWEPEMADNVVKYRHEWNGNAVLVR